jgi:hypothetical protein
VILSTCDRYAIFFLSYFTYKKLDFLVANPIYLISLKKAESDRLLDKLGTSNRQYVEGKSR